MPFNLPARGRWRFRPAGVFVSPYGLHHDARWVTEPDRFDPDRFTPDREAALPHYAHLPFGAGPREYIRNPFVVMEARLVLATLAQRVRRARHAAQVSNRRR